MYLFQSIHMNTGLTILMATHSTDLVSYGTHHVRMAQGQIHVEED